VPKRAHHHVGIEHHDPGRADGRPRWRPRWGARPEPRFPDHRAPTNAMRASIMDDAPAARGDLPGRRAPMCCCSRWPTPPEQLRAIAGAPRRAAHVPHPPRAGWPGSAMTLADLGGPRLPGSWPIPPPRFPPPRTRRGRRSTRDLGDGFGAGPAPARLGPAGEGHARRDRAGEAPRHRAHHGGKITYTGSLGRNGREKKEHPCPGLPTKSYQCSRRLRDRLHLAPPPSVTGRQRQALRPLQRASSASTSTPTRPPCPLTLALFEAEIAETDGPSGARVSTGPGPAESFFRFPRGGACML